MHAAVGFDQRPVGLVGAVGIVAADLFIHGKIRTHKRVVKTVPELLDELVVKLKIPFNGVCGERERADEYRKGQNDR